LYFSCTVSADSTLPAVLAYTKTSNDSPAKTGDTGNVQNTPPFAITPLPLLGPGRSNPLPSVAVRNLSSNHAGCATTCTLEDNVEEYTILEFTFTSKNKSTSVDAINQLLGI
jgi:hypothetical protein